jgi:hypothetical protein
VAIFSTPSLSSLSSSAIKAEILRLEEVLPAKALKECDWEAGVVRFEGKPNFAAAGRGALERYVAELRRAESCPSLYA